MVGEPRMLRAQRVIDGCKLAHLQPSENDVKVWRAATVTPASINLLDAAEPTEEEKEIADADSLACEMRLACARLSEDGAPSGFAMHRCRREVGIEVDASARGDASAGEMGRDRRE